jgi:hypothetical protein
MRRALTEDPPVHFPLITVLVDASTKSWTVDQNVGNRREG